MHIFKDNDHDLRTPVVLSHLSLVSSLVPSVGLPTKWLPEFTAPGPLQCASLSRAARVLANTEHSGRPHGHTDTRQPALTGTGPGL